MMATTVMFYEAFDRKIMGFFLLLYVFSSD